MFRSLVAVLALTGMAASPAIAAEAATLRGSPSSMVRQHAVAEEQEYSFLRTAAQVREYVADGRLVEVAGNADYQVAAGVSYPFARPELLVFVERLGAQYREGCGEPLVVTSLTRPLSTQPVNAHRLSVHPAGMAVDFRVSGTVACREWLEGALLSLERDGLLDVTRERNPPHYHVAVFPAAYMAYVAKQEEAAAAVAAAKLPAPAPAVPTVSVPPVEPAREWDPDGAARFGLVALLAVAMMLAVARPAGTGRRVG
jgi:hypothetical protein